MSTTLTPINLVKDVAKAVALTAIGVATTAETFELTPGVPCDRLILIFDNKATGHALGVSVSAGNYWQASLGANAFSVPLSSKKFLILTGARHKDRDDNTIEIVMTPNGGADAQAELGAIELPPKTLLTSVT